MTIEETKELIKSEQYNFLRENEHLKNKIILLGYGGSHAYGTNTETSDVDLRGIALNSKEDLLTHNNFEQFTNEETDTTIYSFNRMLALLSDCNPNTIEILGAKPEHYFIMTPIGEELIENRKMFLSKKAIKTFGGYANQQLYRLNQISSHEMPQQDLEKHILRTIQNLTDNFKEKYHLDANDFIKLYIKESDREDMETEIFMDASVTGYPLRDYSSMQKELQEIVKSYNRLGKRNNRALEHKKIGKHMMHLVRLYLMCLDILLKEEIITYRTDEHDLLMSIREGAYVTEDNQVKPEFFQIVNDLENRLEKAKEMTKLPEKPDYKKIQEFQIKVNEAAIQYKYNKE